MNWLPRVVLTVVWAISLLSAQMTSHSLADQHQLTKSALAVRASNNVAIRVAGCRSRSLGESESPNLVGPKSFQGIGLTRGSVDFDALNFLNPLSQPLELSSKFPFGSKVPDLSSDPTYGYKIEMKEWDSKELFLRNSIDNRSAPAFLSGREEFANYTTVLSPNFRVPGDDQINGGDTPFGGRIKFEQLLIDCTLWLGVKEVSNGNNTPKDDCSTYTVTSKNPCFMPVISLLPDNKTLENECAGTIIGPKHVLTAAHCVCAKPTGIVVGTGVLPSNLQYERLEWLSSNDPVLTRTPLLVLKDYYLEKEELTSAILPVLSVKVFDHLAFQDVCNSRRASTKDVGIIELDIPNPFPAQFRAVLITPPAHNTTINIAGFGPDLFSRGLASIKRYGSTVYQRDHGGFHIVMDSQSGLRDTCPSDSGSGAYIRLANGRLGVFGVLSGGNSACDKALDSAYVPVSSGAILDWIKKHVPEAEFLHNPTYAINSNQCIGFNSGANGNQQRC